MEAGREERGGGSSMGAEGSGWGSHAGKGKM